MQKQPKTTRRKIGWQIPTIILCVVVIVGTFVLKPKSQPQPTVTLDEEVVQLLSGKTPPASNVKAEVKEVETPSSTEGKVVSKNDTKLLYGFERANYQIQQGEVTKGQTFSKLVNNFVGWGTINRIVEEAKPHFNLNNVKVGNRWTVFYNTYNGKSVLDHFVYEIDKHDILVVSLTGDEISCERRAK